MSIKNCALLSIILSFYSFFFTNTTEIDIHHVLPYMPSNASIIVANKDQADKTLRLSAYFPQAKISVFEPEPYLYSTLNYTTKTCPNVTCHPFALCDTKGTRPFFVTHSQKEICGSLYEHAKTSNDQTRSYTLEVATTTLDAWAVENNIDQVDLLWLDLDGAEYTVLKASPTLLKTAKAIITQVHFVQHNPSVPLYADYKKWLEEQGFSIVKEDIQESRTGTVFFLKNELIKKQTLPQNSLEQERDILLEKCKNNSEDRASIFALAQVYDKLGNVELACKSYTRYTDFASKNEESYSCFNRLATLTSQDQWPLIESYYLRAYDIYPKRAETLVKIAEHYLHINNARCFLYAQRACQLVCPEATQLYIPDKEAYDFTRYDVLGQCSWYIGEFEAGERALRNALELHPERVNLHHNLGYYIDRKAAQELKALA